MTTKSTDIAISEEDCPTPSFRRLRVVFKYVSHAFRAFLLERESRKILQGMNERMQRDIGFYD